MLELTKVTPADYVLVKCINKQTGGLYGPCGMIMICSLVAALSIVDAWKGLEPPNKGHALPIWSNVTVDKRLQV